LIRAFGSWNRVRSIVALAIIAVFPLVWSFQLTLDSYNRPKFAFLVAGVATLAALAVAVPGDRSGAWRQGIVPALALVVPLTISWLASPHKEWAVLGQYGRLQGLVPYLVITAFGLLALGALHRHPRRVAWAIVIAGGGAGLYSLVQAVGLDPFVYQATYRNPTGLGWLAHSTLGNTNFAGAFFALAIPIALALARIDREHRAPAIASLLLALVGLFASFSQGPWGATVAAVAVTLGYWLRPKWRPAAVAGLVVAGAIAVAFVGAVIAVGVRVDDPDAPVSSAAARYWYWGAALEMAADDPVSGLGPNAYAIEAIRYREPTWVGRIPEFPDDPHSVPLAFLANAGVPGLLGYLLFVGWMLLSALRVARRDETGLGAGLLGAVVVYCLVSLVSLSELTMTVMLWAVFVALVGLDRQLAVGEHKARPSALRKWPALILAAAVAAGGWWAAVRTLQADRQMLRAEALAVNNEAEASVAAFRSGLSFWDEYHYRELAGRRIGELGVRRGPEGSLYVEEMNRIFGYLNGFPDVRGLVSQARLLHAWAIKTESTAPDIAALALSERARLLDPYSPLLAAETAQILAALGRTDDAIALLETFVPRKPPLGPFWATLAFQYESVGRQADAIQAIREGLEHAPGSPTLLRAAEQFGVDVPQ